MVAPRGGVDCGDGTEVSRYGSSNASDAASSKEHVESITTGLANEDWVFSRGYIHDPQSSGGLLRSRARMFMRLQMQVPQGSSSLGPLTRWTDLCRHTTNSALAWK